MKRSTWWQDLMWEQTLSTWDCGAIISIGRNPNKLSCMLFLISINSSFFRSLNSTAAIITTFRLTQLRTWGIILQVAVTTNGDGLFWSQAPSGRIKKKSCHVDLVLDIMPLKSIWFLVIKNKNLLACSQKTAKDNGIARCSQFIWAWQSDTVNAWHRKLLSFVPIPLQQPYPIVTMWPWVKIWNPQNPTVMIRR